MKNTTLIIGWGLPGSGKTTLLQAKYSDANSRRKTYSDGHSAMASFDEAHKGTKDLKSFIKRINETISWGTANMFIDILITKQSEFEKLLNELKLDVVSKVVIEYFIPDIEGCLWNDKYRRDIDSTATIRYSKVEEPDMEMLKRIYPKIEFVLNRNKVERKPEWKAFAEKYNIHLSYRNNEYMASSDWCLGGTSGSCWGDGLSHVSAEAQPASFREFDDLLTEVCPNINFLQYKKLYNDTVNLEQYSDGDYYGGSTEHAYYRCHIPTLYDMLNKLNLIEEL